MSKPEVSKKLELANGQLFTVRYPQPGDEQLLCDFINVLSQERTFIRYQGETVTLEEEKKYLADSLKKIDKKKLVQLLVLDEDKLIANVSITLKDLNASHRGILGIAILPEYRGKGLGSLLIETIINEGLANLPKLQLVTLQVFANNQRAIKLYTKMGFVQYGHLPNGLLHKGEYVDALYMYRRVR